MSASICSTPRATEAFGAACRSIQRRHDFKPRAVNWRKDDLRHALPVLQRHHVFAYVADMYTDRTAIAAIDSAVPDEQAKVMRRRTRADLPFNAFRQLESDAGLKPCSFTGVQMTTVSPLHAAHSARLALPSSFRTDLSSYNFCRCWQGSHHSWVDSPPSCVTDGYSAIPRFSPSRPGM